MKHLGRIGVLMLFSLLGSCAVQPSSPQQLHCYLTATAKLPLVDSSAVSANFGTRQYKKVMVVPPSGTARGAFEKELASIEREFMKRGLTVISPAVTARVEAREKGEEGGEIERRGGSHLSDVERALILAKGSNAQAVLQIGTFGLQEGKHSRYFRADPGSTDLREVTEAEYDRKGEDPKYRLHGDWFHCTGRLIDVESGEVVVSYDVWQGVVRNLPSDYTATLVREHGYVVRNGQYVLTPDGSYQMAWATKRATENWEFEDPDWAQRSKFDIVSQILSRVAERTAGTFKTQ